MGDLGLLISEMTYELYNTKFFCNGYVDVFSEASVSDLDNNIDKIAEQYVSEGRI